MAYKVLSKCPVCSSKLNVTKLKCTKCNTVIENEFELSKFSYLDKDQLRFVEVFLKCRGNIKDVEKEMRISYPTVRSKLDNVVESLGYKVNKKNKVDSSDIIEKLEKGEITPDDGIKAIQND